MTDSTIGNKLTIRYDSIPLASLSNMRAKICHCACMAETGLLAKFAMVFLGLRGTDGENTSKVP